MKKLLGLLAATGLVATTGATVVACNNNKDASELASLTIKPGATSVEQKVSVSSFVEGQTALTIVSDKATNTLLEWESTALAAGTLESTVTVKLKGAAPTADTVEKLTVQYNKVDLGVIKVAIEKDGRASITAIALSEKISSADTKETAAATILAAVKEKASTATASDYTVTWEAGAEASSGGNLVEGKTGTVTATSASTVIQGSFTFTITDKEINLTSISGLLPTLGYGEVNVESAKQASQTDVLSAFSEHVQTLLKQDLVIGMVGRDLSSYFDVAGITAMANVSYFSDAAATTPVNDGENISAIKATIKDDKTKTIPGFTVSGTLQLKVVAKA